MSAAPAAMLSIVASRSTRPSRDLQAHLGVVPAADREALPRDGTGRVREPADERRDEPWMQPLVELCTGRERPEARLGTSLRVRRDHIGDDPDRRLPSDAIASVRPITPILAMPYTAPPGTPPKAAPDDTLTKRPPPRSAITAHAGRLTLSAPAKLRVDHRVELGFGQLRERRHTDLSRVVDHDVDGAEGRRRVVDDGPTAFGSGDAVAVGDGLARRPRRSPRPRHRQGSRPEPRPRRRCR